MNQKQIFELIDKFDQSKIAKLKVESEGFKITLESESTSIGVPVAMSIPQAASAAAADDTAAEQASSDTEMITSPIVGTFYRSPATDAPAFVEEGSHVKAGDSICIIEAMKIMNKLEAEYSCEIIKILAENGQMVEYGAPLFEVKRA